MYNSGKDVWAKEFRDRRPDVSMATIEAYLHSLYRVRPTYSVERVPRAILLRYPRTLTATTSMPFLLQQIRSSTIDANKLFLWPHATRYQRVTPGETLWWMVD